MHHAKRDPVTGQVTTGHEWNGIEELDTPVPRVVLWFLWLGLLFSLICWLLLPAFPLLTSYTKGWLGIDQQQQVEDRIREAAAERAAWESQLVARDFASIQADPDLLRKARELGQTLFQDNCAACHGVKATGGPGFPDLTSRRWLWGGEPEQIAQTIRVGINSSHEDTRVSQMMAFGRDGILTRQQVQDVVAYVQSLSGTDVDATRAGAGKEVFAANCVACHGDAGKGNVEVGAPDLTDRFWIYGGDEQSIYSSVYSGRQGHMPHWNGRLSEANLKVLALYVATLEPAAP